MQQFEIIVGSMLGASEYVADALAGQLQQWQYPGKIHLQPDLAELDTAKIWCICTSTHGAGDLPDNIQPLAEQLQQADLSEVKYILVGLGDSSYDTFCHGAKKIHDLLQQRGAKSLVDPLFIDVLEHPIPEDEAVAWLQQQHDLFN